MKYIFYNATQQYKYLILSATLVSPPLSGLAAGCKCEARHALASRLSSLVFDAEP